MTTLLREMYDVLGCFNTAAHTAMCKELLEQLKRGTGKKDNLAAYFADALKANKGFDQLDVPFVPEDRHNDQGTNPVTTAMRDKEGLLNVKISPEKRYEFTFRQREIPHLRAANLIEQDSKAWIDYVASTMNRPILGEVKWEDDKNSFYAFIQLLTYLSEMATSNQIKRATKHKLFWDDSTTITAFDLHIFLANFNDRGTKGPLIELTRQLASAFKQRLQNDHPDTSACLGDVLCFSGHIEDGSKVFSKVGCHWAV